MAQSKSLLNDLSRALDLLESENARLLDDNEFLQGVVTNDELRMQKVLDENAKLRDLVRDFDKCLDTALWLASEAGYPIMPDQKLFDSLRPRMRELGVEVS